MTPSIGKAHFFKTKEKVIITKTEENKQAEDVDPLILSEDKELES
jgi:hypothetical protein